jgi:type IV secretory pathway TrbL component
MIEASLMLLFIGPKDGVSSLESILARSDNGERAMSLRSVTEKIDNIVFSSVAVICLLIWAIIGFSLVIEIATTAVSVVVIYFFLRWMESRH